MEGIRVSIFLSILKPKKYSCIVEAMVLKKIIQLKELSESNHKLYEKYYQLLNNFLVREEISLSSDLKRERSEQLRDDECFEKIEKKIKID